MLLVHAMATWFMVGLIWTIQTVHYPLFRSVGENEFVAYERGHTRRMGGLLAVPAGVEVLTGLGLVWFRPSEVGLAVVLVAGVLLAGAWVTTALVQVPLHRRLSERYDPLAGRRLVTTNWLRTALWSGRGLLVAAMLAA
jgi:hypothetical protein